MIKNKDGSATNILICLFMLVAILALIAYDLTMREAGEAQRLVEDGLMASTLASAVIDIEEFGKTNTLKVRDDAYSIFEKSLKENLRLETVNGFLEPRNTSVIAGPVIIEEYIVYNVKGNDIIEIRYINGVRPSEYKTISNGLGTQKTPNGKLIETATVYSKISLNVRNQYLNNFLNKDDRKDEEIRVYKERSVDIKMNDIDIEENDIGG